MSQMISATVQAQQFLAETCTDNGGGLLDWTCGMADRVRLVIRAVAITVAVIFVVYKAVTSKFAIGTIIVSALAAGVFIWIVFNVMDLQQEVGNDLDDIGNGNAMADASFADPPV